MKKQILFAGLLGGIVIFGWLVISTGPLPLNGHIPSSISKDKEIHSILKDRITKPGIYFCPDHPEGDQDLYPDYGNEPLFFIIYGGRTPNTFMGLLVFELVCIFGAPIIAAWLLSMTSSRILAKYSRRALFVMGLGLFVAVWGDLFSEKPINKVLLSSINNIIMWALVGLVIAWRFKPDRAISGTGYTTSK